MEVVVVSMRTAQLCESGATVRTRRTVEGLAERGHDVTVLCARWWGGDLATFEQGDVTYRAVTASPAAGTFATRLPAALARVRPDVVHAANSPPAAVRAAKTAATALRAPLVVDWWTVHEADSGAGARRAARAADLVTVPSRLVGTEVREYGASDDAVEVVPESIDVDLVRSAPVDSRADVVYARRLDADANVESLLLALAEFRDRTWRAAVVGDGPARADAEAMAADLRIDDRVTFLGDLPPADLVPVLKGAHVFAQTATSEPFATELLWALACGCVGVVEYQAASSAHELVEGDPRGFHVTSPQELASKIVAAADLERRVVDDRYADYDHGAVVGRLADRYRTLVDERGLF